MSGCIEIEIAPLSEATRWGFAIAGMVEINGEVFSFAREPQAGDTVLFLKKSAPEPLGAGGHKGRGQASP
jgi:hypothetical protein